MVPRHCVCSHSIHLICIVEQLNGVDILGIWKYLLKNPARHSPYLLTTTSNPKKLGQCAAVKIKTENNNFTDCYRSSNIFSHIRWCNTATQIIGKYRLIKKFFKNQEFSRPSSELKIFLHNLTQIRLRFAWLTLQCHFQSEDKVLR